jgi:basic membrane protein A
MIQSVADDEPLVSYQTYDLAADGVGYSTSGDFLSEDVQGQIDDFAEQIKSGDIEVPDAP